MERKKKRIFPRKDVLFATFGLEIETNPKTTVKIFFIFFINFSI